MVFIIRYIFSKNCWISFCRERNPVFVIEVENMNTFKCYKSYFTFQLFINIRGTLFYELFKKYKQKIAKRGCFIRPLLKQSIWKQKKCCQNILIFRKCPHNITKKQKSVVYIVLKCQKYKNWMFFFIFLAISICNLCVSP